MIRTNIHPYHRPEHPRLQLYKLIKDHSDYLHLFQLTRAIDFFLQSISKEDS